MHYTPSTASSQHQLSPAPSISLMSHLSADLVVLNSPHSHNYELTNEFSLSSLAQLPPDRLPPNQPSQDRPPPDEPSPNTPPIPNERGHLVHLQTCSIQAFKCICNLARSRPPYTSPISLDHSLQAHLNVHTITVFSDSGDLMASEGNA